MEVVSELYKVTVVMNRKISGRNYNHFLYQAVNKDTGTSTLGVKLFILT